MCALPTPSDPWPCCAGRRVAASDVIKIMNMQTRRIFMAPLQLGLPRDPIEHPDTALRLDNRNHEPCRTDPELAISGSVQRLSGIVVAGYTELLADGASGVRIEP